jgi:hypothetical protein
MFVLFCFFLQAYIYTKASKIVGVEMNADLCNIQNRIVKKYNFQVFMRFRGHVSDVFSDILSCKLAPLSVPFSYWVTSHCTGSLFM